MATQENSQIVQKKIRGLTYDDLEYLVSERKVPYKWALENCRSMDEGEAGLMLGYPAKSAGIMLISAEYGQWMFRPYNPWPSKDAKEGDEPPKYRNPQHEHDLFLPQYPGNKTFWSDIDALKAQCFELHGKRYIVLTEGGIKAITGCAHSVPTVAVPGVWMGLTAKAKGTPDLVPALRRLVEAGFGVIIAFDSDTKPKTVNGVKAAEIRLTERLKAYGCDVLSVTGQWKPEDGKGMDDFINNKGIEAFRAILMKAEPIAEPHDTSGSKKKDKFPSADATAQKLAEDYRDRLAFNNEVLCWYRYEADTAGAWSPETDEYIESIVYQILKSQGLKDIPPAYVPAVVKFLRNQLIERKWKERKDLLPFQNGALEITTGSLLPHSPGYKFTWSLPRQHSAIASDWSKIADWLDFVTKGNQHIKNLLLAFCNAVLKGRADIQKFLHLIGIGGSGKGTLLRMMIALIGVENTHSSTLDDWCSNRFETAQIYKKRLLVFPDEDKGTPRLGKFKQVTGGDWLRAEEKGKKPFKFQFEGMVVVASNFPIFGSDNSSGMARRTIAVPFDAVVSRNARRNLDSIFEPELAAFTNHLLSLEDAWVERTLRGVIEIPEINLQGWENTIRENPIAGFLNDRLIYDPLAQTSIGDSAYAEGSLYQAYDLYCSEQGHKPQAIKNFSPNLIELASTILGWQVEKVHTRVGKIIKGLRLRAKADEHIPTYDYDLHSRCDGFGDGLVTDAVTGQNPYPEQIVTGVTDKPITRVQRLTDDIPITKKPAEEVQSENIHSGIELYPSHQSPELEPLPIKDSDPSPNPSHDPSPNPSPISQSPQLPETFDSERHAKEYQASSLAEEMKEILADPSREKAWEIWTQLKSDFSKRCLFYKALGGDDSRKARVLFFVKNFPWGTSLKVNKKKYGEQFEGVELKLYDAKGNGEITCRKPDGSLVNLPIKDVVHPL